jgi:hypothetical protein
MTVLPPACIGHWYTSLLYLAPVVGLVGLLSIKTRLDKRRDARDARIAAQPKPTRDAAHDRAPRLPMRRA